VPNRPFHDAKAVASSVARCPFGKKLIWQTRKGLTQLEIAERLGLSKNIVETYMIRTLRHLRDRLDASAPGSIVTGNWPALYLLRNFHDDGP